MRKLESLYLFLKNQIKPLLLVILYFYFVLYNYSVESQGYWAPLFFHLIPILLILIYNNYKPISTKLFVVSFFTLYIIYFFEIIKPIIKLILIFDFYAFILLFLFLFFLYLVFKEKFTNKIIQILIISLSFLCLFEIVKICMPTKKHIEFSKINKKYNVFFIVLDEYTSLNTLKKEFNYNNRQLDTYKSSFLLNQNNYSYYPTTYFSINHLFNLERKKYDFQLKNYAHVIQDFYENFILNLFDLNNYKIKVKGAMDCKFGDSPYEIKNIKYYEYIKKYNRISSSFFMQILIWKEFNSIFNKNFNSNYRSEAIKALYSRDSINNDFKNDILNQFTNPTKEAFFNYYHFLVPHAPYCYKNGIVDTNYNSNFSILKKSLYINNIKYCDKNILIPILDSFLKSSLKENTILVIQGDHGYRGPDIEKIYHCDILNIIYLPEKKTNINFDNLSNTNTFIRILNQYFNQNIDEI
jgi:hypothetical protein